MFVHAQSVQPPAACLIDYVLTKPCHADKSSHYACTMRPLRHPCAVYNRDNRLKVAQDEAKAKEAEDKERERAENAEREYRHQLLLQRAGREHDAPAAGPSAAAEPVAQIEGAGLSSGTDQQQPQQQQLEQLEHINFWREDELKAAAQHPEVEVCGVLM